MKLGRCVFQPRLEHGGGGRNGQQVPPVSMEFQSLPMLVLELGETEMLEKKL